MSQPRLGINATILDPQPSGLGRYTIRITNEVGRHFDDSIIFTSCPDGLTIDSSRVRAISDRVRPSRGRSGHLSRWGWLQFRLPAIARQNRINLVFSTVPEGFIGRGPRQVLVVHDLSPIVFPSFYPRLAWYFRVAVPRLLDTAAAVICVSDFTKAEVIRIYGVNPKRVHVVYESTCLDNCDQLERDAIREKFGMEKFLLCVASELSPRKNLQYLLTELAPVLRERRELGLVIVGKHDRRYLPGLQMACFNEKIDSQVRFVGYVDDKTLSGLYRSAEMLVYSSLYEGFGLPILEAMALGTPVVTFDVSCLPEVAGNAAEVVPINDADALRRAVVRILDDRAHARHLVELGRLRAREFSWENAGREIARIIRGLV